MSQPKAKRIFQILLILGSLVSLYFVPWPIVKAWLEPVPESPQKQVDKAGDYGFDGIIVYVDAANGPGEFYTSGYKNREQKVPADPRSLFKIASVGKLYTALAITKLAYAQRLSLDNTLDDYFPELTGHIENAEQITIRMLVQHRSGIPNYTDINDYWAHPRQTEQERLELILDLPANFKPNEDFEYCNTNYLLLSRIIEKVTGMSRFAYITESILTPLGLVNTYGSILDVNLADVMSGYYVGYESDLKTDNNGTMLATAEDLGKFIRSLNDGSVFVDQKERDLYSSLYRYGHTGLIPGYQTIARYHEDLDAVVIQFTNTVNFDGYNWNLSEVMYNRIVKILRRNHH